MIWRIAAGTLAGLVAAYLGVSVQDRDPPTEFNHIEAVPYDIKDNVVRIHFHVYRHRFCALKEDRVLYDSARTRWILEDIKLERNPGPLGTDYYVTELILPPKMRPGKGTYVITNSYYCNPIHHIWPISVGPMFISFNVVPAADGREDDARDRN